MHAARFWRQSEPGADLTSDFDSARFEEWRSLADYLPTLCWIAQADGYIVWYNKRWHDYCGSTPDEMAGWGWQSVHDPERLPDVLASWTASIATGEPFEMTFPLRGADGVFRPFLTRIVPVRDEAGEIVRWFGVNMEISGQIAAEEALEESEAKFSVLTDAMPQMVWSTRTDGYHDYYNAQWYAFTGVSQGFVDGKEWAGLFHEEDRPRAWERWRHSLATGDPYEVEYRLRQHDGDYRWVLGRALPVRNEKNEIVRWIGTCTDIHEAKISAEQNELLNRELSHRIKNIFAVIVGLLSLASRKRPELRPAMSELMARVAALGRAHDFARPHSDLSAPAVPQGGLKGLLEKLLEPYQSEVGERVTVASDDIAIDDRGATPIALVVHELATNSAKYGALSAEAGTVAIEAHLRDGEVWLTWREMGGPRIAEPPTQTGFGSELASLSIERQLGGILEKEWREDGLMVTTRVRHAHLHRETTVKPAED